MTLAQRIFAACLCFGLLLGPLQHCASAQIDSDKLRESIKFVDRVAIYDYAKILDEAQQSNLEEVCRKLRENKKAALVVVTLPDLAGGQIDDFAVKLFNRGNKKGRNDLSQGEVSIGDAKLDNGVLLLIAMQERKARIEVGDGLEGILPDGLAIRVLEKELFPQFKQKNYSQGISATVNRLATILEKAEKAPKEEALTGKEMAVMTLFLTIFVAIGSLLLGGGIGGRQVFLVIFGLCFAGFPFLVGAAMASPYAPILHSIVAIPLAILGWRTSRNGGWTQGRGGGNWGGGSTGIPWDWGSIGSGSSFGGGSSSSWSGGGFSSDWGGFGGGSSSGGGASGGW